jgi:hypothetical protein
MIRLFRRVRNKLLSEKKFGIYVLYATGEIVLVMVGILLALQIDNWNEDRKDRSIEEQYMERLLHDLQNDVIYFESQILLCERAVSHLDSFLIEMYIAPVGPDDVRRITKHGALQTDDLTLKNSTYRELISTGSMNIFSDQNIKAAIMDYYHLGEETASQIKEFNLFSTQVMTDVMAKAPSFILVLLKGLRNDLGMELFSDPSSEKFLAIEQTILIYRLRNSEDLVHYQGLKMAAVQLIIQVQNTSLHKKQ